MPPPPPRAAANDDDDDDSNCLFDVSYDAVGRMAIHQMNSYRIRFIYIAVRPC